MSRDRSLKQRALHAGAWAAGSHFAAQALRLVGNLVLTRFLLPEAFGLMAVISTLLMALNLLSDIGSGTVVVQSERGAEEDFVHTAWTLQVVRGFVIWGIGVLGALGITFGQQQHWFREGTVYDDARLPLLIAVSTFAMVLTGFTSLNAKLAERRLDLRRVSAIELGVQLVALVAMIAGAVYTKSVWALVFGSLFAAALKGLCSHVLLPGPRARFRLEREAVRELLARASG
jgi:O-antigen/teichoic acid export membrane protein